MAKPPNERREVPRAHSAHTAVSDRKRRIDDILRTEFGYSEARIRQAWNGRAAIERAALMLQRLEGGK